MRRTIIIAALALAAAGTFAAPAVAHQGDPRYDSVLTGAGIKGLDVQVLNYGDRLLLRNHTGETVTLVGYESEPYARMLADGTVQINERSPATYLNNDPYGRVQVPAIADAKAPPRWKTLEGDDRFETHDHRIHWMSPGQIPGIVTDQDVRTKVYDWSVPVRIGSRPAAIRGTLWWRGEEDGGGMPVGAIGGFGALVVGSLALVVVVRRRRARAERAPSESAEAW